MDLDLYLLRDLWETEVFTLNFFSCLFFPLVQWRKTRLFDLPSLIATPIILGVNQNRKKVVPEFDLGFFCS